MKNKLLKFLTLLFALCMVLSVVTACGGNASNKEGDNEHVCVFNKKDVSEQYKKSDATCESPEEYYYSWQRQKHLPRRA